MEKLNIQDLLPGHWIRSYGENDQILDIDQDEDGKWWFFAKEHNAWCDCDEIYPIPLDSYILEETGFIKVADGSYVMDDVKLYPGFKIIQCGKRLIYSSESTIAAHQLQDIFRLCRIKKEIKGLI